MFIAMFSVMSRTGHVGLFIPVVGKKHNMALFLVFLTKFTAKEKGSWRECCSQNANGLGIFFLDFLKVN